ncbi:MAG TPA: hypothetical protein VMM76_17315 [Pirellulaceae bacterium]|nr:hypothetical protein [Pirellulaceae bacterium]
MNASGYVSGDSTVKLFERYSAIQRDSWWSAAALPPTFGGRVAPAQETDSRDAQENSALVSPPPYREGKTLSCFIAKDIRRDILVLSAARVDDGIITGRVRTTNLLYLSHKLIPQPEFEPARELRIDEMWHWTGKSWGGLSGGTSLVGEVHRGQSD